MYLRRQTILLGIVSSLLACAQANEDYENQFSVCSNSAVIVEDLSISCDSDGAYYYGGNKYRNSEACKGGDKARLQVVIEITDEMADYEVQPYFYLQAVGYGSVNSVDVYKGAELCSLSLKSLSGGACPEAGIYQINEVFFWGNKNDDYDYSFQPHISIGIASSNDSPNSFDLGGANTKYCATSNVFTNWADAPQSASKTLRMFALTFGALASVALIAFGAHWCFKRRQTQLSQELLAKDMAVDDDELGPDDFQRIAMMGREKDLIDA